TLDHRLVAKHPFRVRLPGADIASALRHPLRYPYWVVAVFSINNASARIVVLLKIHTIELRVAVDDARPAVNANNRNDAIVLVRECVILLCPGIQSILVGYDQEGGHLGIGYLALESGCFERFHPLAGITFKTEAGSQFCRVRYTDV